MARRQSNRGLPEPKRVIRSFGEDRVCSARDCRTKLSRYNPDDWCFSHRHQVPLRPAERRRA
jgi:hypothetical protein